MKSFITIILLTAGIVAGAQQKSSPDDLFQQARQAAFENKDYEKAISLSRQALAISPDYSDIRIFLGRIYSWSKQYDSARQSLLYVLNQHPDQGDAASAMTDVEYWSGHYQEALKYCEQSLQYHPASEEMLLKKARILYALKKYREAYTVTAGLIDKSPGNGAARSLLQNIRYEGAVNRIGIGYDFTSFDRNYATHLHKYPWHFLGLDYSRYTGMGSVTGRINYGNRFNKNAFQFEVDAYPRLKRNITAYLNAGVSDTSAVFARYRAGLSLIFGLPKSFEAEAGFRYLYFSNSTWIYVAGLSKYYKNFWFGGRSYLVPHSNTPVSHSHTIMTRYYFGGAEDYWQGSIGYGISPDEPAFTQPVTNNFKVKTVRVGLGYRRTIHKMNNISMTVSLLNQEYAAGKKGNQLNLSCRYQRRF